MKPNWFDILVYKIYYWRWNRILKTNPEMRKFLIEWMKAFDNVKEGEEVTVTITKVTKCGL